MISLYGLDVKESPDGTLTTIEINGCDSGTDFFKNPAWHDYYFRFMNALGEAVQGKAIFIQAALPTDYTPQEKFELKAGIRKHYEQIRGTCQSYFVPKFHPFFWFDWSWLDDLENFQLQNIDSPPDREELFYVHAGRQLGLHVIPFTQFSVRGDQFTFRGTDQVPYTVNASSIGCIWAKHRTLERASERIPHHLPLFVNTPLEEILLGSKVLFDFTTTPAMSALLPQTVVYGLGVGDLEEVIHLHYQSSKIVRKRGGSSCGTGVSVTNGYPTVEQFSRLQRELRKNPPTPQQLEESTAWIMKIRDPLEEFISLFQIFIKSKPVYCHDTAEEHDGCARLVVIHPQGREPVYIGGQWRLAPEPLRKAPACVVYDEWDDLDGETHTYDHTPSLNQSHRANLSRGAIPQPLSSVENKRFGDYAVNVIGTYAEMLDIARQRLRASRYQSAKDGAHSASSSHQRGALLGEFWAHHLLQYIPTDKRDSFVEEALRRPYRAVVQV